MENFASTLDYHVDRRPEKVVLRDDRVALTNRELFNRVNALAAALAGHGLEEGDVVAMLLPNRVEFVEIIYAVNRLGAVFLPINTRLAPDEWDYILTNSLASVIIADPSFVDALDTLSSTAQPRVRVAVGGAKGSWLEYEDLVQANLGERVHPVDVEGESMQRLMYTSGTTSRPKGVCLSHRNVTAKNLGLMVEFGLTDRDVTAVAGPMYHVGALDMGGLATLHAGGSLVLQSRFEPAGLVDLMAEHQVTTVWLAPAMINALLQSEALDGADLTSLRAILSGGEKMPEARLKQILTSLPHVRFADAYGLTETASSDTFVPHDHMYTKLGSVGRPIIGNEVRIGNPDGLDVPAGTLGEILIRGPKVFTGYWRDARATYDAFVDGWFRTGDLGRMDEDGYLYIDDRKKDMVVSGGENIATPEVERVLYEHPEIVEAAVVGHPDERWGEVPHAFIVVRAGSVLSAEDVNAFCRERLAKFKAPKYTTIIEELPRTASGKVVKRELRTLAEEEGS